MRDDFPRPVVETLAKRVGNRCSNPGCRKWTSGPHSEDDKSLNVGVAAHITAASLPKPMTQTQTQVETLFPAVAKWVNGYGHIEIGDQEGFGFVVRAIDYGGVVFEDDTTNKLAEAMAALEKGLADYFEREGIE